MLTMANAVYEQTHCKRLVMAGGVALNSVANYKVLAQTPFEQVYIQPAAGDDGGALGAALWAYHVVLNQPRKLVMTHAYYGQDYSDGEIKQFLDAEAS